MKYLPRFVFIGTVGTLFLMECASADPIPPMFDPGGTGVLLFVLVVVVSYFIWNKFTVISTRLDSLEKEIKNIKSETKGVHHD